MRWEVGRREGLKSRKGRNYFIQRLKSAGAVILTRNECGYTSLLTPLTDRSTDVSALSVWGRLRLRKRWRSNVRMENIRFA